MAKIQENYQKMCYSQLLIDSSKEKFQKTHMKKILMAKKIQRMQILINCDILLHFDARINYFKCTLKSARPSVKLSHELPDDKPSDNRSSDLSSRSPTVRAKVAAKLKRF